VGLDQERSQGKETSGKAMWAPVMALGRSWPKPGREGAVSGHGMAFGLGRDEAGDGLGPCMDRGRGRGGRKASGWLRPKRRLRLELALGIDVAQELLGLG
jgi:hypothetical protein